MREDQAERWLRLAGCETIFRVSSYTGEGIWQILEYLREPGDVLPWDKEEAERPRVVNLPSGIAFCKFAKINQNREESESLGNKKSQAFVLLCKLFR